MPLYGLILGQIQVNIFVNGLGKRTESILSEFVGDAKLRGVVDILDNFAAMWMDLQQSAEMCTEKPHEVQKAKP